MAYKRKLCDPGECGRMDYESRIAKLEAALHAVIETDQHPDVTTWGQSQRDGACA